MKESEKVEQWSEGQGLKSGESLSFTVKSKGLEVQLGGGVPAYHAGEPGFNLKHKNKQHTPVKSEVGQWRERLRQGDGHSSKVQLQGAERLGCSILKIYV